MRCLGRLIALFLLMLAVMALPFAIWMIAFWDIGTNPDNFNRVVNEPLYERLAPLTLPLFAESITGRQETDELDVFIAVIDNIDTEAWEDMSEEVISPEWLSAESQANFSNGLSYLNGDTDELNLVVNVAPVREHLVEGGGIELVDQMMLEVGKLDDCTSDQEDTLKDFVSGADRFFGMPNCKPVKSPALLDNIRVSLENGLTIIVLNLPEDGQFVFHEEFLASSDITESQLKTEAKVARREFQMAEHTVWVNCLIPVMLLGLIIVFAVRTAKELFFWLGLLLISSGLISVLPVVGLLSSANRPLQALSRPTTDDLWIGVGLELINSLAREISGPIVGSTFLMIFFGFVALVLSTVLRTPQEEKQEVFYMPPGGSTPIPMPGVPIGSTPTPFPAGTGMVTPPQVAIPTPPPSTPSTPLPTPSEAMPDEVTVSTPPPVVRDASSQIKTDISELVSDTPKSNEFTDDRTYIPQNDLMWDGEDVEPSEDKPDADK